MPDLSSIVYSLSYCPKRAVYRQNNSAVRDSGKAVLITLDQML